ncbi:MAG TPA: hypothetical protein ENJ23_01365, partial [Bacteroidetes bacterium]|nr:hypothetical protein [Bacteroidota bacterium]
GRILDESGVPLDQVQITASTSNDSFFTETGLDGSFVVSLRSGTYRVTAEKPGYAKAVLSESISVASGEEKTLPDYTLKRLRGNIAGEVRQKTGGQALPETKILARSGTGSAYQALSDNSGKFQFTDAAGRFILLPGRYTLIASKAGFRADTLKDVAVQANQTTQGQFLLEKNLGEIRGTVVAAGSPVEGATITATYVSSGVYYTAISAADGTFAIRQIPVGSYEVRVARSGYTSPPPQTVATGAVLQLELVKNDGRIHGVVSDRETGQPVRGARVYADDSHGNNGKDYTDSQGRYEISELPKVNPYTVTVTKSGYQAVRQENLSVTADTRLDVQLSRLYGNISGHVLGEDQQPMAGVTVRASSGQNVFVDTTGSQGTFSFVHVPAGQYTLTASKVGFQSDPVQQIVSLWQGGSVENVDFTMKEAKAAQIEIVGPELLSNQSKQQYTFVALTADKRSASIAPQWSVDLPAAVDSLTATGLLDPKDQYIGPLTLILTDTYSGVSGKKSLSVLQPLTPRSAAVSVSDQLGAELTLADSTVAENVAIQLRKPVIPPAQRATRSFQVLGDVYQFSPENLKLLKPATLSLPVPEGASGDLVIGRWDLQWLEWKPLESSRLQGKQLEVEIEQLGRFAVLGLAEPLSLKEIELKPNPFSPQVGPLRIRYVVTSNQTTSPMVTIKIYNMVGDLVRNLVSGEPQPRGENVVTWDGTTDHGRMARNGRYVLQLKVRDLSGEKEALKTFVLIK